MQCVLSGFMKESLCPFIDLQDPVADDVSLF